MIKYLNATIVYLNKDYICLDQNGIGYAVFVNSTILQKNQTKIGEKITLFIQSITKEDGTTLYGFETITQRAWFNEFIKLSGISGRIANIILSNANVENLDFLISTKDEAFFSSISGIGKKLAARIVTEMLDASKKVFEETSSIIISNQLQSTQQTFVDNQNQQKETTLKENTNLINDTILALEALGFNKKETIEKVIKISNEAQNQTTQDIIKKFLKK